MLEEAYCPQRGGGLLALTPGNVTVVCGGKVPPEAALKSFQIEAGPGWSPWFLEGRLMSMSLITFPMPC